MKVPASSTVLAPVLWGTTYITITELLPAGRPFTVACMRVLPSGLVLVLAGRSWRPASWRRTIALGLVNFGIFFPLLVTAAYRLPGGVAAAAGGLQPLFVAALGALLLQRRPSRRELLIGVVAATGVALVVLRPGAAFDPVGVLAAVLANVSFATGIVLTKRLAIAGDIGARARLVDTGQQLLVGAAVLLPLALLAEGVPPAPTLRSALGYTHLAMIGTALAFVIWFSGIRHLPVSAPPLLGLAAPVTGVVIGWARLGQSMSPSQLVGFSMTLSAIAYGAVSANRAVLPADGAKLAPWATASPTPATASIGRP